MFPWLRSLQVNDTVVVCHPTQRGIRYHVRQVQKVGIKYLSVSGVKYRLSDGARVGKKFNSYLIQATPDLLNKLREQEEKVGLVFYLTQVQYEKLPLGLLQRLKGIIEEVR